MRNQMILAAFTTCLACAAQAQEPRDFALLATQTIQLPRTTYSIVFNSPELQIGEARDISALSLAIGSWLSANFDLPAMRRAPRVVYASASEIALRSLPSRATESVPGVASLYDARSRTIFLPEGWNGSTPTELSVFVRELTYHLLNESGNTLHCTPANDEFVLAVQRRWLVMTGADKRQPSDATPGCPSLHNKMED